MKDYIFFVEHHKSEAAKRIAVQAYGLIEAIEEVMALYGDGAKSIIAIEVSN